MISDPTKRFSDRVDNYVKYRPGYPAEVIAFLQNECDLSSNSVIADIGSGTGIFTKLLLDKGYKVYAVEPNADMQQAAKEYLGDNGNFIPTDGSAEETTLPSSSIDLIVCAQAFHWFNNENAKAEFKRVLRADGKVALIAGVTKDLTSKVHAGKLIQALAKQVGGSGGGRPDLAEAGGKDTAALKSALLSIPSLLEPLL